jgi:hypothetical protein
LNSQEIIDRFASLSSRGLKIVTYDSLTSKAAPDEWWPKNVLTLTKRKLMFKHLHQLDIGIFAWNTPSEIILTPAQRAVLINEGYDIPSWERGELLTLDQKYVANDRSFRRVARELARSIGQY